MKNSPPPICKFLISIVVLFIYTFSNCFAQQSDVPFEIAPMSPPFEMPVLERPEFPDQTFDIRDYGAVKMAEDESHKNTDAFHRAIEAAYDAGGGKVLVPEGDWLSGPIHLMSNINLHVSEGATIYFSTDKEDYLPVVKQRHEGVEAFNYSPMIYAYQLSNVAITGKGVLDAQGEHWWEWYRELGAPPRAIASKVPLSRRDFGKGSGMEGMRPNFVIFWESENILVEGVTLNDSPMWNVHLVYSNKIIVRDIRINSLMAPNGDGVVIDSSKDVLIEYNHFETGDDAVVLKSGLNEDGLNINIPTENVVVRNFEARDVRTGSGGVVFGSETSGGIKNVYVHNALFDGSDRGVRFKTERGRGNVVENIYIHDIEMRNITYEAINFNTFYTGPQVTGPSPQFRNIYISDIHIDGVPNAIVMTGLPEKWLENINLKNIVVASSEEGVRLTRVKDVTFENIEIHSTKRAMIVEDAFELTMKNVTLEDSFDGTPLLFRGLHTGAVFLSDFPLDQIEFEDGLSSDILLEEPQVQEW
ncbi:glycoside hydrolase family 28 protein [Rhodohalobacter sp. SW132]|nr:glycoside hydrolase family 28 protein [Rhodohalobacter sp. SW132]